MTDSDGTREEKGSGDQKQYHIFKENQRWK